MSITILWRLPPFCWPVWSGSDFGADNSRWKSNPIGQIVCSQIFWQRYTNIWCWFWCRWVFFLHKEICLDKITDFVSVLISFQKISVKYKSETVSALCSLVCHSGNSWGLPIRLLRAIWMFLLSHLRSIQFSYTYRWLCWSNWGSDRRQGICGDRCSNEDQNLWRRRQLLQHSCKPTPPIWQWQGARKAWCLQRQNPPWQLRWGEQVFVFLNLWMG